MITQSINKHLNRNQKDGAEVRPNNKIKRLFEDFSGNECIESNEYSGNFYRSGCLVSPAHGLLFPVKQHPFQSIGFVALHTFVAEDFPLAGMEELKTTNPANIPHLLIMFPHAPAKDSLKKNAQPLLIAPIRHGTCFIHIKPH
jgi:hypothetical protein